MDTKQELIELFSKHVSSGKAAFFEAAGIPFVLGEREGPYIRDLSGEKELIDCHCNGGVFNLGHRNPEIISTLAEALRSLDIGNHHLISRQRALLARKLAELAPGELAYTVFGVGGGEAMDLAIKVSRGFTKKNKVISAKGGYHGHTGLALAAGDAKYRVPFLASAPNFVQVPFNDLGALASATDDDTAVVILETIPATLGIVIPDWDYLQQVRELCDDNNVLLAIDEVQAGLGRTGRMWAIEHFGVAPDILVIGKGLSGGVYPIAATCFNQRFESVFHGDPFVHVSTFGGAELGCEVALKVLEISSDPDFLRHVRELGDVFANGLNLLREKHPSVMIGFRQLGLMIGLVLPDPLLGPLFTRAAYESGLLSVFANNDPRVAQVLPPLNVDQQLATEILRRIDMALSLLERPVSSTRREND
jgi:acetylornithine/succinyldiaminopimelate/putrescine aminotransferase